LDSELRADCSLNLNQFDSIMALYLARSGKHGEWEAEFLEAGQIRIIWGNEVLRDLSTLQTREELREYLAEVFTERPPGWVRNAAGQIWTPCHRMKVGDWVAMPSKMNPTIHIGEVTAPYKYDPTKPAEHRHSVSVNWFAQDIPRERFDQDILYSLGAFMTFCQIKRNDAEARVRAMAENDWKSSKAAILQPTLDDEGGEEPSTIDIEEIAQDQLSRLIIARFKGDGLEDLVGAILKAQGFVVHSPPKGADHGVDLLAAPDTLGFGTPRVCVQVKSSEGPIERVVLDQLIGTMQNFGADQGLLVSWGGFKSSIEKERAKQFFRVRLWNRKDLISELLAVYERLPEEIQAELPLKRIWTVAVPAED
jgi:restriction system protein